MVEPSTEPIVKRIRNLNNILNASGLDPATAKGDASVSRILISNEGLLDTLFLLYEECNNDHLKKDKVIAGFVDKFRATIHELRKLRISLNDFEQKKVIGKGHFGIVQVVREKQSEKVFALKSIRKSDTLSQELVAFYEEERDIMAKAVSPWITKLQYAFQDDQLLYLVMEFHPGGDLLSLLDRFDGIFSESMARFYLAEITLAIHDLHNMGYVHRDIKPDNILIDRCGHVKLADFGSAAKLTSSGVVRSKMAVGTPDYISPEVLASLNEKPECATYGVECDFWSLGIVAYEMLYGETPFKGEKTISIYSRIFNHKENLKYPEEEEVSTVAKDLISGLLVEANHRLSYTSIIHHKYFLCIDWNDIRNTRPPFVPVVTSTDDTSNFEEFEHEQSPPNLGALCTKRGFSGRNLPFIGFTYARPVHQNDRALNESFALIDIDKEVKDELDGELQAKEKELHNLKLQIQSLQDGDQGRQLQQSEKKVQESEIMIKQLEEERSKLEKDVLSKENMVMVLKKELAVEKSERSKEQGKIIELVRNKKNDWMKQMDDKTQNLKKKLQHYEESYALLDGKYMDALNELREVSLQFNTCKGTVVKLNNKLKDMEKGNMSEKKEKGAMENVLQELEEKLKEKEKELEVVSQKLEAVVKLQEESVKEAQGLKEENLKLEAEFVKKESEALAKCNEAEGNLENMKRNLALKKEEASVAESRIKEMKEKVLREKEAKIVDLEKRLTLESKECLVLKGKLQELSGRLNESLVSLETKDSNYSQKEQELEGKIDDLEEQLICSSEEKSTLKNQLSQLEAKEGEHKVRIGELETILTNLDQTLKNIENQKNSYSSNESSDKLTVQIKMLEGQLESAKEASVGDRMKVKELSESLSKKEGEVSNLSLELRGVRRELKSIQDTVSYLREKNKENREEMRAKEASLQKSQETEEDLKTKISALEKEITQGKEEVEALNRKHKIDADNLKLKIEGLEKNTEKMAELKNKIIEAQRQADTAKVEKKGLEMQLKMQETTVEEMKTEKQRIREELKTQKEKIDELNQVITMLKQLCSDQDEQLNTVASIETAMKQHATEKAEMEEKIEKLQKEVRESKVAANEEKSLRFYQEKKTKDLENELADLESKHEEEFKKQGEQLDSYTKINLELTEQIHVFEKELNENSLLIRNLERQLAASRSEVDLGKEELAGHISNIHSLKNSNFKLTQGLEEALKKAEKFKERVDEMQQEGADMEALHKDAEIKMKGTISQQTKLIDFLQAKAEKPPKKKTLSRMIFSGKEKENVSLSTVHQYRELEDLLKKERAKSSSLKEQLNRAKAEVVALQAENKCSTLVEGNKNISSPAKIQAVLSHITDSPSIQPTKSKQRMRHSIPHRWNVSLIKHSNKCAGCMDRIPFGRSAMRCRECGIVAHKKCSEELPSTCGLPSPYAHHYAQKLGTKSPLKSSPVEPSIQVQGWLKVPKSGKGSWELRFGRLEGEELCVYDHEPSSKDSLPLQPRNRINLKKNQTNVISTVPHSELPNTASVDQPYVLKIVHQEPKGPSETHYLMTTNFEEKQMWITALESLIAQVNEEEEKESADKGALTSAVMMSMSTTQSLDVRSLVHVDNETVLVGAVEGLYSFEITEKDRFKSRAKIAGISTVYQLLVIKEIKVALMIGGNDRYVYQNDMRTLTSAAEAVQVAKPSITPERVEPIQDCHLVAASQPTSAGEIFICAAASDRISILKWCERTGKFMTRRQYSTQVPCSCLHFTKESLIVGSEKFYEIDLKTFSIEEFLDESDPSLAYAVTKTPQVSSNPIAILQISPPGKYEEFLMCFYEFAAFVDPFGRRSREHDITFSRIPQSIAFHSPYLYVVYQNAVEVTEIKPQSFTKTTSSEEDTDSECGQLVRSSSLYVSKPVYLGPAAKPGGILISSRRTEHLDILELQTLFNEDSDLSMTWGSLPVIDYPAIGSKGDSSSESTSTSSEIEAEMRISHKRLQSQESSNVSIKRTRV
ncbi:citron rho-interacting kinase sticky [Oratosquilla oratoria]|uniref:citron rho-interacting kinase sticky n=1 Tax=Oratosquilla oratoria TaxID=337810 RepID=UPI003F774147